METETKIKKQICKYCVKPQEMKKLHQCLDWRGCAIHRWMEDDIVANLEDVKRGIQRLSKLGRLRK